MYIHVDDTPELADKVKEVRLNGEKYPGTVKWVDTDLGAMCVMRKKNTGRGYEYPIIKGKVEIVFID